MVILWKSKANEKFSTGYVIQAPDMPCKKGYVNSAIAL